MGSFCFKGRIQTGGGRLTSPQSSSGTEERKTGMGFWPFKTDVIVHYFVLLIFSNT